MTFWLDYSLLGLILLVTFGVAASRDLLKTVILLSCYSMFTATLWMLWGGVDVGFTEVVVGAAAGTVLFVALLWQTSRHTPGRVAGAGDRLTVACLLLFFFVGAAAILSLPAWNDPSAVFHQHVSPDYLREALHQTHTPNVVTAVLADYRGFDTLLETSVIFTAGIACWLLGTRQSSERNHHTDPPTRGDTSTPPEAAHD